MLKKIFIELVQRYVNDEQVCTKLWSEIEKAYTGAKRYYHNLSHLEALFDLLSDSKQLINNWDTVLFSLFYHDIVYNVVKPGNEQKSAASAVKRLKEISFPAQRIEMCYNQILATSSHGISDDPDTNFFTDADLSILGKERPAYEKYCEQIRKEYAIFPDLVYVPGRKKVITYFLQMQSIYKTALFLEKFEQQARNNLSWELEKLSR